MWNTKWTYKFSYLFSVSEQPENCCETHKTRATAWCPVMASGTNSLWTRRKTTQFRTCKWFPTCHLYSHGLSVYPIFMLKNRPEQILKRRIPWNFWPYGGWLRNPAPPNGWLKPYKQWDKPPIEPVDSSRWCFFFCWSGRFSMEVSQNSMFW